MGSVIIHSMNEKTKKLKMKLTPFQHIIIGFLLLIIMGAILLVFPFANQQGKWTSPIDALFTATSAACVTGLVVHDTATYWNGFGQFVIIGLIQIGGLGVASMGMIGAILRQKKIGLSQRMLMQESISLGSISGIVGLTKFFIKTVVVVEIVGAVLLYPTFSKDFGWLKGIWYSIFHSISAFCNAGFDLMGVREEYSSLTYYYDRPMVLLPISALIIIGGLGFLTWRDIAKYKFRLRRYHLQSKIIILMTTALLIIPTLYLFFVEYDGMTKGQGLLSAWFQSVTARTAGFNSTDLNDFSGVTVLYYIILMITGGAPGSTAGGMKVTTLFVVLAVLFDYFHGTKNIALFHRSIPQGVINHAIIVFILYISMLVFGGTLISGIEHIALRDGLFEVGSAIGTVGLSMGVTPTLCNVSKIIIVLFMFVGRVGGVTIIYSIISTKNDSHLGKYPEEDVAVG